MGNGKSDSLTMYIHRFRMILGDHPKIKMSAVGI